MLCTQYYENKIKKRHTVTEEEEREKKKLVNIKKKKMKKIRYEKACKTINSPE